MCHEGDTDGDSEGAINTDIYCSWEFVHTLSV